MVSHDPRQLDILWKSLDERTGPLVVAQRFGKLAESELGIGQILERAHQRRRFRPARGFAGRDRPQRELTRLARLAASHQQSGELGERTELMALQGRALFALGDFNCLAQRGLRGLELVETLERLSQPHVTRDALRRRVGHGVFDTDLVFGVQAHRGEVLFAPGDIDVGIFDGRRGLAHRLAVFHEYRLRARQRTFRGVEVAQVSLHLREPHQHLLELDPSRAGISFANAQCVFPRGHRVHVAALARCNPRVGHVNLGHFRRVRAETPFENRSGKRQQRHGLRHPVHERDQRRAE
jgi:hypothetical protein